jgi:hypothetical protein
MKHLFWAGLAGLACLAATAAPAFAVAIMMIPTPLPQRVALADVVVVGKVTGFGDKLVSAKPPYGGDKVDYQIAIVQVGDAVLGAKDAKEIKVGFMPAPAGPGPGPIRPGIRRFPQFNLTLDQEGCLFLMKHPTEDFYIGQNYNDFISKKDNADFDKNMDEVKRCVKLLADPMAALKGKNADDRTLTAEMLAARYRIARPGATKTEAIDAEESKQILLALADADWTPPKPNGPGPIGLRMQTMTPQNTFFQLGVTPADGWTPPRDAASIPDAAKQWCKDNAEKYRIQRFVADEKEEKKGDK